MAAAPDSGSPPAARIPPAAASSREDLKQWVEYAVDQALTVKQAVSATADSAVTAAAAGLSHLRSASSFGIGEAKGAMEQLKTQYSAYEDMAFGKIKEGILIAAAHPELSCAVAAGTGLVMFKGPRRFFIQNTRRIFMSEESLLSDAEAKVNELRQSINLVRNESKKLEERALKAEEEMEQGRMQLVKEGRAIKRELCFIGRIEKQAMGLKDFLRELSRREASRYQSEVSALVSQVKKEKKALNHTASKIINYGIPL